MQKPQSVLSVSFPNIMSFKFGDLHIPINFKKEVEIKIQKELKSETKKRFCSQLKKRNY